MPQGTLQAAINLTFAMAWILIITGAIILGKELWLLLIYAIRKKGKEKNYRNSEILDTAWHNGTDLRFLNSVIPDKTY